MLSTDPAAVEARLRALCLALPETAEKISHGIPAFSGRTGVEMEAMTASAVAALTVYDMVKGLERGVRIESIELLEKSGGRSGHWRREGEGR